MNWIIKIYISLKIQYYNWIFLWYWIKTNVFFFKNYTIYTFITYIYIHCVSFVSICSFVTIVCPHTAFDQCYFVRSFVLICHALALVCSPSQKTKEQHELSQFSRVAVAKAGQKATATAKQPQTPNLTFTNENNVK